MTKRKRCPSSECAESSSSESSSEKRSREPEPRDVQKHHGAYDLQKLGLPMEAWPDTSKPNRGAHSFTICAPRSGARVEVLLRSRAFFFKAVGCEKDDDASAPADAKPAGGSKQVSWRDDVRQAWQLAKQRAQWS